MKSWSLDKKLDDLEVVLKETMLMGSTKLDPDCFTDGEKRLFQRIEEMNATHGGNPPSRVLAENMPFNLKATEVLRWRALDVFMTSMQAEDPIKNWYFKLHLVNFLAKLNEVYDNLERWTKKDRKDFLDHTDLDKVFPIPSSSEDLRLRNRKTKLKERV